MLKSTLIKSAIFRFNLIHLSGLIYSVRGRVKQTSKIEPILVNHPELEMGISVTKLLIILAVVIVLFGTQRLRNVGSDLGAAIKNFRGALKEGEEDNSAENKGELPDGEEKPGKDEKTDAARQSR